MKYTTVLSTETLAAHLGQPDWVIVDCRFRLNDPEEGLRAYREAHLPGALYAHLGEHLSGPVIPGQTGRHPLPRVEDLVRLFSEWGIGPGIQVVAYDDMGGGMAAARLWWLLRWLGHEAVAVLDGGIGQWQSEGRPLTAEISTPKPAVFTPQLREDLAVDASAVDRLRLMPDHLIVDSRAPERYRGEVEPIDPVAGHIPGAVNLPHMEQVGPDGKFLPPAQLQEKFNRLLKGKKPEHTVFYCGSGVTGAHNVLAMEYAGLEGGKLYPGSWSEWITDPSRPVEKGKA